MGLMLALPFTVHAWLSGWDYRSEITLSSVTTVANYQVKVELTSVNFNYLHAQTNGEDIRFTDTGENLQDYWIEEWNDSGTSTIWVEVATSGTSTFYMYFDNASASDAANGDNTFDFFDDFAGSTLDLTKWTIDSGSVSVANSEVTLDGTDTIRNPVKRPRPLIWRTKVYFYNTTDYMLFGMAEEPGNEWGTTPSQDSFLFQAIIGGLDYPTCYNNGTITSNTTHSGATGYHVHGVKWKTNEIKWFYDDVNFDTFTTNIPDEDIWAKFNHRTGTHKVDWIMIGKYSDPEPTSTVGTEEQPTPVVLSNFTAIYTDCIPVLCWTTQSETGTLGWNVYRGENESALQNDETFQVNPVLIEGAGTTSQPTDYLFADEYEVTESTTYWYWIESRSNSGTSETHGPVSLTIPEGGDDPDAPELDPNTIRLSNYPNPFLSNTEIQFYVKHEGNIQVSIFNLKGQKIDTVFNGYIGENDVNTLITKSWDGLNSSGEEVESGIYLYKLETGNEIYINKMILLR